MKYIEFEKIFSIPRISRYLKACSNDKRKSIQLYKLNLKLSQQLFTIESCFEVAIRNKVDVHYTSLFGKNWLVDSINAHGIFDNNKCRRTAKIIKDKINILNTKFTHPRLVAEMDFGFWRYLFAKPQFRAGKQSLLLIFPKKPKSSISLHYDNKFVYNELQRINDFRNRLAHHEPICFQYGKDIIDTHYSKSIYNSMIDLLLWMAVDTKSVLYGIDHTKEIINKIDNI